MHRTKIYSRILSAVFLAVLILISCAGAEDEKDIDRKIIVTVNDVSMTATLADNASADAFLAMLREYDLVIEMSDYGNFEKVGPLGTEIVRSDEKITTTPGDIILYLGSNITIYYDKNTWNFTLLGHIDGATGENMRAFLGDGNPVVMFSLPKEETHKHTEVTDEAIAPTCTEDGMTEGIHCSVCGTLIRPQETVPATGHMEVTDAAKDATCTEEGMTEGSHCSVCGTVIRPQETVPATGHTVVVDDAVAATCMLSGLTEGSHCSVCGEVLKAQEMVPLLDHDFDDGVVTKEATFTENGIRTYTCKRCGGTMEETISIKIRIDKSGWVQNSDGTWSYGDADGNALVGPQTIGGVQYCFNEEGKMITGWELVDGKWYYAEPSGALYNTGWTLVNGTWYYFRASGEMATGWISDGGVYYYMKPDGTMATGWVEDNGDWYFMADSGAMMTGWMKSGTDWYLLKSSGKMATGWQNEGGFWYYFKPSGVMADGWNEIGGSWYYFKNGAMVTGWFEDKEAEQRLPANQKKALWYWFDSNGAMAKGWQMVNGQWEMFDEHSGLWLYTWQGN